LSKNDEVWVFSSKYGIFCTFFFPQKKHFVHLSPDFIFLVAAVWKFAKGKEKHRNPPHNHFYNLPITLNLIHSSQCLPPIALTVYPNVISLHISSKLSFIFHKCLHISSDHTSFITLFIAHNTIHLGLT